MRGSDGEADAAGALGNGRRPDGGKEQSFRAAPVGKGGGFPGISHDEGQDGCMARQQGQARLGEGVPEEGGIPAEPSQIVRRVRFEEAEGGQRGGRCGRADGGGEDEGPRPVPEPFHHGAGGTEEAPFGAEGLAEGAYLQVDDAGEVPVFGGAPAGPADDARGVGIIHEEPRVIRVSQLGQCGQIRHVAVHAEYAVGDDEALALAGSVPQEPPEGIHVAVGIDRHGGAGDAAAVDEAGVVQAVAEDDVPFVREAVEDAQIGHVPRIEYEGRLVALEAGQLRLQIGELEARPGGEARPAGAGAPPEGLPGGGDDGRLVGHAEVVIGMKDEAGRAVPSGAAGGALHAEVGNGAVFAAGADGVQRGGNVGKFHGFTSTSTVCSCIYAMYCAMSVPGRTKKMRPPTGSPASFSTGMRRYPRAAEPT